MKVSEIIYACLDLAKAATSDDAFFTEEFLGGRHADRVNGIREVEDANFK